MLCSCRWSKRSTHQAAPTRNGCCLGKGVGYEKAFLCCLGTGDQPIHYDAPKQCSRLKPSYEFHFEGLSNFSISVEGLVQIQDVKPRIWKWSTQLILNLCMNYMIHVFSIMWRIKNQPSNITSCSDNALRLLVLVAGRLYSGLQVRSSFCNLGLRFEGLFWERYMLKGQSRLKGIEDFNLEHCHKGSQVEAWSTCSSMGVPTRWTCDVSIISNGQDCLENYVCIHTDFQGTATFSSAIDDSSPENMKSLLELTTTFAQATGIPGGRD